MTFDYFYSFKFSFARRVKIESSFEINKAMVIIKEDLF